VSPIAFALEYWKIYESYMERKERLIYTAATLYFGLVVALLLARDDFWVAHTLYILVSVVVTAIVVMAFVRWQFTLRSGAAAICNASQTLAARWLESTPVQGDPALAATSLGSRARVEVPAALHQELIARDEVHARRTWATYLKDEQFELSVYALIVLATLLIVGRWSATAPTMPCGAI
jgi:hypothetical protein